MSAGTTALTGTAVLTGTPALTGAAGLDPRGMLLGLVAGAGLWLVLVRVPLWRRTDMVTRLAPHLRDASRTSRLLERPASAVAGWRVLGRLLLPVSRDGGRWLDSIAGGGATVRRRLLQAGGRTSLEQFRAEQVLCGAGGLAAGLLLALALAATRGAPAVPLVGLVLLCGVVGVLARDWWLGRAVRAREERMLAEFPTVAELLALSVAAGEGAVGALQRVADTSSGELAGELRQTLADARAGRSIVQALEGMAVRTSLPSVARFVDGVAVAVERGTPLADVLRAQAQDVRELSRRRLMEAGGKKEIHMMVPVVFLVLPVTVLFAVYPGMSVLANGF